MKSIYFLVYQAGIANVFKADVRHENSFNNHRSIGQSDFKSAESFCRGLREAGATVKVAWDNSAGDITANLWHFSNFQNAPFNDKFSIDFVPRENN